MSSGRNAKLIPVVRRPRRTWQIPTSELYAPSAEQKEREAYLKAFTEGTTPYGREIFRRILGLAARRLQEGNKSTLEVTKEVAEEMGIFSELHAEFVLLLARTMERDPEELRQVSPFAWAFQMLLWMRASQRADEEQAAEEQSEQL
jgi:hypothetical protein